MVRGPHYQCAIKVEVAGVQVRCGLLFPETLRASALADWEAAYRISEAGRDPHVNAFIALAELYLFLRE